MMQLVPKLRLGTQSAKLHFASRARTAMLMLTERDLFAAGFSPGFVVDPVYWRVYVDSSRYLRQEVVLVEQKEVLHYSARLPRAEMELLWPMVERIGYRDFKKSYRPDTVCSTDRATHWLIVRLADCQKEVSIYDLVTMAEYEHNPVAIGFLELWERLNRYAPHGKVPVEADRPKPWWRIW